HVLTTLLQQPGVVDERKDQQRLARWHGNGALRQLVAARVGGRRQRSSRWAAQPRSLAGALPHPPVGLGVVAALGGKAGAAAPFSLGQLPHQPAGLGEQGFPELPLVLIADATVGDLPYQSLEPCFQRRPLLRRDEWLALLFLALHQHVEQRACPGGE